MPMHIFSWVVKWSGNFIVRVEVIKIQIWFEFKLVQNLEKIWKLKSISPFSIGHGPNSTQPAHLGLLFLSHVRPASQPSEAQQHQCAACTSPTDSLRSPHNDEAESELELETPPGKISHIPNIQQKRPQILTKKCVGLESAPITSTRMETPINRNRIRLDFVHPELKP
jgi:hypothetical protein